MCPEKSYIGYLGVTNKIKPNKKSVKFISTIAKSEKCPINSSYNIKYKNFEEGKIKIQNLCLLLDNKSLLYKYLTINCKWIWNSSMKDLLDICNNNLLSLAKNELTKDKSYLAEGTDLIENIKNFTGYSMEKNNKVNHPSKYFGVPGCYLISCNKDNNLIYIGSALDLYKRFKSHKINHNRPHRGGNSLLYQAI